MVENTDLSEALPYIGLMVSVAAVVVARWQGAQAAQKYMLNQERRTIHERKMVESSRGLWDPAMSSVGNILYVSRDYDEVRPSPSPFGSNQTVSYFESHLEKGYPEIWGALRRCENRHAALSAETLKLVEDIRSTIAGQTTIPPYDRKTPGSDHISYGQLLVEFFSGMATEVEGPRVLRLSIAESHGDGVSYGLDMMHGPCSTSRDREKTEALRTVVMRIHDDSNVRRGFEHIYHESEKLNGDLKDVREKLEYVWSVVDNGGQLEGTCDQCKRRRFKRFRKDRRPT